MTRTVSEIARATFGAISAGLVAACAPFTPTPRRDPTLSSGWKAWEAGDFAADSAEGSRLAAFPQTADAGYFMLALVSHVTGDHRAALAHHGRIAPTYRWLSRLEEPILWSYVHLHDYRGARAFARTRPIGARGATRARLELAVEHPLAIEIPGLVEVPFTNDALTPYMPGFAVRLNGRPAVARLDTGGSFIHVSAEQAASLGIAVVGCETTFAALSTGKVCYGITDLEIASVRLHNVPVAVHHGVLQTEEIARAFGVDLGPIIGTNVLQQFLVTVDAPGRQLVLSPRGDAATRAAHLGRLVGEAHETPFVLWSDHRMIVRARVGSRDDVQLFVDSGLVAVTQQGQAALLAPRSTLRTWGASIPPSPSFAEVPGAVEVGGVSRDRCTAFVISDRDWRKFGDWGRIEVSALVSWGFLNHFAWTIDFDHYTYSFSRADGGLAEVTA